MNVLNATETAMVNGGVFDGVAYEPVLPMGGLNDFQTILDQIAAWQRSFLAGC